MERTATAAPADADTQHVDDVIKCAECQLRTGPLADKFSDDDINRAKDDSRNYCKDKGFATN